MLLFTIWKQLEKAARLGTVAVHQRHEHALNYESQIKVVKAFHSSLHENIQKPYNQNSIHNFMTHPEFAIDEELPRTPLLDEEEEKNPDKASNFGTRVLLLDGEVTPYANTNNNAVDCNQVQISHTDSPLQSLETSV
ncbi:Plasma membrane calcium-transporting ATPase 4 [Saguinus oedipus]|uniref:Plasma membrane calcium-transporting ATPase 4 n=1 Tax=Saguinus oedipus TaxID=9490 RepID=A0ABQ9TNG2_SAGOE|nr:Plasma membrane calcium-transporting ATPase 4 [Saguinus oedipus]